MQTASSAAQSGADRSRSLITFALCVLAGVVVIYLFVDLAGSGRWAVDYRGTYWVVAQAILHGHSPYVWSESQLAAGTGFPYPPVTAFLLAPSGLLPEGIAAALAVVCVLMCAPAILLVVGVRDLRVYAVTLLLAPVFYGWHTANLTLPATLAFAVAWRYRERAAVAGLAVALAFSLKPYLWPLGFWLLAAGRYRALGWAIVSAAIGNGVAFLLIGPHAISQLVNLSRTITHFTTPGTHGVPGGYGLHALPEHFGLSPTIATVIQALVVLALIALTFRGALPHGVGSTREPVVLALSALLTLAAAPLAWGHYPVVLLVPLAVIAPELELVWWPLTLWWLCPEKDNARLQLVIAWFAIALTGWMLVRIAGRDARISVSSATGPN